MLAAAGWSGSRVIAVPAAGDAVCAVVSVGCHAIIAVNAALAGQPAWAQAVDHAERHLALGHRVVACGTDCLT